MLRPGYIQIRVTDLDVALKHYVDRVGLHEVSREADGRAYLRAWDEFDRHSVVLRKADMPGMDYVGFKVASEVEVSGTGNRSDLRVEMDVHWTRSISLDGTTIPHLQDLVVQGY